MRLIDADAARTAMLKIAEDSRPGAEERPIQIGTAVEYVRMRIAEAMIEWLDALPTAEMPGWVSAKDRLPERSGVYLAAIRSGTLVPFYRAETKEWLFGEGDISELVRYWMQLPEPPEEASVDD